MEQQQLQTNIPCLLSILKIVTTCVKKNEHTQNKIGTEWDAEHLKSKKYHMIHARHVIIHGSECTSFGKSRITLVLHQKFWDLVQQEVSAMALDMVLFDSI